MTEYELADLINGVGSNLIAMQALFITVLSAYLVVAYSVGKDLSTYQVSFINFIFLLFVFIGFQGQTAQFGMVFTYSDRLMELRGDPSQADTAKAIAQVTTMGIRFILAAGALVFMWQVRHPKTE